MAQVPPQASGSDTTARLRHDIDSGRTKDKVAVEDPAAAPLGTDEEAAGTPPRPAAIAEARRQETSRAGFDHAKDGGTGIVIWMAITIGFIAAIAAGVWMLA